MTPEERQIALNSSLLKVAPRDIAQDLLANATIRVLRAGERLFEQDDDAKDAFVMLQGWLKLVRCEHSGEEAVLEIFTRGESVAEAPAVIGERYPAAGEAATAVRVLAVPGRLLREAATERPDMAIAVMAAAFVQMRKLLRQIKELKAQTAPQRVARFLADLAVETEGGATVGMPFEKALIAARLGITPSTLSRTFRKLREIGVIVHADHARIDDVQRLRAYGDTGL